MNKLSIITTLEKFADAINLSSNISDEEKQQASQIIQQLNIIIGLFENADKHLDMMYNPFKQDPNNQQAQADLIKHRGIISDYNEKILENFEKLKSNIAKSLEFLSFFGKDSAVAEISNTFEKKCEELFTMVQNLSDFLKDIKTPNFIENSLDLLNKIKKEIEEIKEFIKDRIIQHLDDNIIGKKWFEPYQSKIKKEPYLIRLVTSRK